MEKREKIQIKIDKNVLVNYVQAMNSLKEPISKIESQITYYSKSKMLDSEPLKSIYLMVETVQQLSSQYINERSKLFIEILYQIMNANHGMISTRLIEPLHISRQYLSVMEKKNLIEKVSRGIYLSPNVFEDSYFLFQQKYKQAVFSHMNALYFHDMTEEFPNCFTVTVPQGYHVDMVNEKCNVFYVSKEIYEMGIVEVTTPNGNKVRAYDKERCICDIIRANGRMDSEQVKKSIRRYLQNENKNLAKLAKYSEKLGIHEKVMKRMGEIYDD